MFGVVARAGAFAGAPTERGVEFVHEEVDGFVGVVAFDGGNEVGAADFDAAFGDEALGALGFVVVEIDPHAVDARLVTE